MPMGGWRIGDDAVDAVCTGERVVEGGVLGETSAPDEESEPLLSRDVGRVPLLDAHVLVGRVEDRAGDRGERGPERSVLRGGQIACGIVAGMDHQQPLEREKLWFGDR